ncbi:hypothetical protein BBJ28_00011612 [Nothophytophthora sp. Chile5]|nr:hypothetical protein BBJ28_00011612 [Nothophytophthora sp. Chile5]
MHVKPSFFRARQAPPKPEQLASWTSDHADPSGKSSMGVLLDWLTTPGNYDRWRCCDQSGDSQHAIAEEIVDLLHAAGLVHRTIYQVCRKVSDLERSYREAAERLASTKRELKAAEGTPAEPNLHRVLERHCRFFALLQPIMKEKEVAPRPKKRPRLTTRRKVVRTEPAAAAPAPSPVTRKYRLRERPVVEEVPDQSWEFDEELAPPMKRLPTPVMRPTSATRTKGKGKRRTVESISVMQLEEEHEVRRQEEARELPDPPLRSIETIDLEKARMELALRRLEVQVARDKALVVRVKARTELVEQGVPRREIDRLLPLNM